MKNVIYITNGKAALVQGNATKNGIKIEKYFSINLPAGVIADDGTILDLSQANEQISDLILMANVSSKKFTLCLHGDGILFREMTVPKIKKHDQKQLILNEFLSEIQDGDSYIVDYIITKDETAEGQRIALVFGMKKDLIAQYDGFFQKMGLKCSSIDVSHNSVSKLSTVEAGTNNSAWCVMETYDETITLRLIDNGYCRFSQQVNVELPKPEEQKVEFKESLLEKLRQEYAKIEEFQKNRLGTNEIQGIYLMGDYGELPALGQAIIQSWQVPCKLIGEAGKITGNAEFIPHQYGAAVGALIRRS